MSKHNINSIDDINNYRGSVNLYFILCEFTINNEERCALKSLLDIKEKTTLEMLESSCSLKSSHPTASDTTEQFADYIAMLGLGDKFPSKLKVRDAMVLRTEALSTSKYTDNLEQLPFLILHKIMMCDSRSRAPLFNGNITFNNVSASSLEHVEEINPLDCLIALLHCCDNFLCQELFTKLSNCQIAIPMLLPNPDNGNVIFMLWAMRAMIKSWKSYNTQQKKVIPKECRITDCNAPIISFLKIGEHRRSKSAIINNVITDTKQDVFFHWDCEGGTAKRLFVDGTVEMSCFVPSGKHAVDDFYSDMLLFANLRGDARRYAKQIKFFEKLSFMSFVLLKEDCIDDAVIKLLTKLSSNPGGVVILLPDMKINAFIESKLKAVIDLQKTYILTLQGRNNSYIISSIRNAIQKSLFSTHSECKPLANCTDIVLDCGINIDECNNNCFLGKNIAENVMNEVKSVDISKAKLEMLPLQGSDLWHEWATLNKESYRHQRKEESVTLESYNTGIEAKKKNIRKKQIDICKTSTSVMKCFLDNLLKESGSTRIYFLYWLKMMLDDYSREKLPDLVTAYQNTRRQLFKLREDNKNIQDDSKSVTDLKIQLKEKNDQLVNASFGLEHFFREMGQRYEAVMDSPSCQTKVQSSLKTEIETYPKVIVELLGEGYMVELMDGDASHVPKCWVTAIINQMKSHYMQANRIYVISILGLQSSGKSTLLNTAFGLHFHVSAGRCTIGAYCQLLPLDDALRKQTNCDHILIVDTEGLRAPELQYRDVQQHDNELATFVIGLADVTIVNIFGEVPGDLSDILETAVFAFIRMKEMDIQLRCHFVHQNVSDVMANDKGKFGRHQFQDTLDVMTNTAAKKEHCESKYRCFSDVIYYNSDSDVTLFPTLWRGDPPMAPVNSGYSNSACHLKQTLIELLKNRASHCSFSEFELRVSKLWEAILRETFIFSFKNTLEIIAFDELDTNLGSWSWTLRRQMLQWQNESANIVNACDSKQIKEVITNCLQKLDKDLNLLLLAINDEMSIFFEKSDKSSTLAQWRHNTEVRLENLLEEHKLVAKKHCEVLELNREGKIKIGKIQQDYRKQMQESIAKLILEVQKSKMLSPKLLESRFNIHWQQWLQELKQAERQQLYPTAEQIDNDITNMLNGILKDNKKRLTKELKKFPLSQRGKLELSILSRVHLDSKILYNCKWNPINLVKGQQTEHEEENLRVAEIQTKLFLDDAQENTEIWLNTLQNYSTNAAYDVIMKLHEAVNKFNKSNDSKAFTFTPAYMVDMVITVAGYCTTKLISMVNKLRIENDPIQALTRLYPIFFQTFKSQCLAASNDKTAADNLCSLISTPIQNALKDSLRIDIVEDMKKSSLCFGKKNYFKVKILESLAQNTIDEIEKAQDEYEVDKIKDGYFSLYKVLLSNVSESIKYWSKVYTSQHCCAVENNESKFLRLAKLHLNVIIHTITCNINDLEKLFSAKSNNGHDGSMKTIDHEINEGDTENLGINEWLSSFYNGVQKVIKVDMKEVQQMIGAQTLQDVKLFSEQLIKNLSVTKESIIKACQNPDSDLCKITEWDQPPHLVLYDTLVGCKEQCPFCKEQCEYTDGNHEGKSHFTEIHRPKCLGKYKLVESNKLSFITCIEGIEKDQCFQNSDTNFQSHPYKDFQKYYPNWVISNESPKAGPKYWRWFCATFNSQIIDWINCTPTSVQELGWHEITGKDAIESLYEAYRIK